MECQQRRLDPPSLRSVGACGVRCLSRVSSIGACDSWGHHGYLFVGTATHAPNLPSYAFPRTNKQVTKLFCRIDHRSSRLLHRVVAGSWELNGSILVERWFGEVVLLEIRVYYGSLSVDDTAQLQDFRRLGRWCRRHCDCCDRPTDE